jgi:isocitrate dehydrogenase
MSGDTQSIIYTHTDEAPALATYSLLPVIKAFTASSGVNFETKDISLSGRIIANFPERLTDAQRQPDALAELGELAKSPEANIIKLPNISASIPQLKDAITELQAHGYDLPDFPEEPSTPEEEDVKSRYAKVLGSAVNPVLREGNSDRRVAGPVKDYARKNPHRLGEWEAECKSHVAHMAADDFFGNEKSHAMIADGEIRIEHVTAAGETIILKPDFPVQHGEVIDATRMRCSALREFLQTEIDDAKEQDVLLSLHMKATMMKVSDPIIFGHAVTVYFKDVFEKHADTFETLGVDPKNGLGDVYSKIESLSAEAKAEIEADIQACYEKQPKLAMVNSDKGITNLHVPSDIIIDASMPNVIRDSGCMWGPDGELHPTKAVIPDRSYAGVYQAAIDFCKENGAFDVSTMGNVANVGLMAQKAEEYGSHDKTFEVSEPGAIRVVHVSTGKTLLGHPVEVGDIWRACQTKDEPIRDWVRLAVDRARATGSPAIFWLDKDRAHDAKLINKVGQYLPEHDTGGLNIQIMTPVDATLYTCKRAKAGLDTISVTGNVLRDYLTDLFPIIELGTSAKMLSIVPLLAGGGLFETGAGGSAPKHVQQFVAEGHLRWDSLGEFLAIGVSLEDLGAKTNNSQLLVVAKTLNDAIGKHLDENRSPSRKVNELDNRGSHFYLAMYWAEALVAQGSFPDLAKLMAPIAAELAEKEDAIVAELNDAQGEAVDIGGYFQPDVAKTAAAMRPSATFNAIIDKLA